MYLPNLPQFYSEACSCLYELSTRFELVSITYEITILPLNYESISTPDRIQTCINFFRGEALNSFGHRSILCTPGGTLTHDLRFRRTLLCTAELPGHYIDVILEGFEPTTVFLQNSLEDCDGHPITFYRTIIIYLI